ncbi:hypothetical protein [Actinomycetospora chlora]|uniref:hypothetical protein n=1 Tax=Actinomycetospora chlora TaxID=663608 RepID=UPI0031EA3361
MQEWARRAGVVLVAMAIVALHHLVAAHQHSDGDDVRPTPDTGLVVGVANLHVHPDPGSDGHDGTGGTVLLYLSLAVIAAAVVWWVALVPGPATAGVLPGPRRRHHRVRRGAARPPPGCARLAQLQVLRV